MEEAPLRMDRYPQEGRDTLKKGEVPSGRKRGVLGKIKASLGGRKARKKGEVVWAREKRPRKDKVIAFHICNSNCFKEFSVGAPEGTFIHYSQELAATLRSPLKNSHSHHSC